MAFPGQAALRAALQGQGRGGTGCAPQRKPGDTEAAGEGMERGLAMGKGDKGRSLLTALLCPMALLTALGVEVR